MSETVKRLTVDTLIPVGLAITLAGGIFYLGVLASQIGQNSRDIRDMESWKETAPTAFQFSTLQTDIAEIKADLKQINNSLK